MGPPCAVKDYEALVDVFRLNGRELWHHVQRQFFQTPVLDVLGMKKSGRTSRGFRTCSNQRSPLDTKMQESEEAEIAASSSLAMSSEDFQWLGTMVGIWLGSPSKEVQKFLKKLSESQERLIRSFSNKDVR